MPLCSPTLADRGTGCQRPVVDHRAVFVGLVKSHDGRHHAVVVGLRGGLSPASPAIFPVRPFRPAPSPAAAAPSPNLVEVNGMRPIHYGQLMDRTRKVFVSHASEDKDRFVREFAAKLLAEGIETWLDEWELAGGDSLPDRIFREGIGESDAVVVVVSHVSVTKRWVREELDVAVVRRIERECRLIPVVLDKAEVPVAISHLLRYDVESVGLAGAVDGVVRTVLGVQDKPPLGEPPAYTRRSALKRLSDPVDDLVYGEIIAVLREAHPNTVLFSNEVQAAVEARGVSTDSFRESMEALTSRNLVDATPMLGHKRWRILGVSDRSWLDEEERSGVNLSSARRQMLSSIVNDGTVGEQATSGALHWRTTRAILGEFQSDGLIGWSVDVDGKIHLGNVSPLARRRLRSLG